VYTSVLHLLIKKSSIGCYFLFPYSASYSSYYYIFSFFSEVIFSILTISSCYLLRTVIFIIILFSLVSTAVALHYHCIYNFLRCC
jgi:hypothetical protein